MNLIVLNIWKHMSFDSNELNALPIHVGEHENSTWCPKIDILKEEVKYVQTKV